MKVVSYWPSLVQPVLSFFLFFQLKIKGGNCETVNTCQLKQFFALLIKEVEKKLEGMISLLLEIVKSGIEQTGSPTCAFFYSIYVQSTIIFQLRPSHLEFWIPRTDRDRVVERILQLSVLRKEKRKNFLPVGSCFPTVEPFLWDREILPLLSNSSGSLFKVLL